MRWSVLILMCLCARLAWGENISYSVFISPIHPSTKTFGHVKNICRDGIGRFWVMADEEVVITTINSIKNITDYKKDFNAAGLENMGFDGSSSMIFGFDDGTVHGFNLHTHEWKKQNPKTQLFTPNQPYFEQKTSLGNVLLADDRLMVRDRFGVIIPISLRTNKGPVNPKGQFLTEGKNLYYVTDDGIIYYVHWLDISALNYVRFDLLPTQNQRITYPINQNKILVSADTAFSPFIIENNKQVINLCHLEQNKQYCSAHQHTILFHCTTYDEDRLLLIDEKGTLHLLDIHSYTLSREQVINKQGLFLKNMTTDHNGNIWVGTYSDKLVRYHPRENKLTVFDNEAEPSLNDIFRIYEDRDGWIWIGMSDGMLIYIPEKNRFFTFIYDATKFPKDFSYVSVSAFAEDDDGRMWIGTYAHGLYYFDKTNLKTAIRLNKKDVWRDVTIHSFSTEKGLDFQNIKYLNYSENGSLFVRMEGGMAVVNKNLDYMLYTTDMGFPDIQNNNYNYSLDENRILLGVGQGVLTVDIHKLSGMRRDDLFYSYFAVADNPQNQEYKISSEKKLELRNDAPFIILKPDHPLIPLKDFNLSYTVEGSSKKPLNNQSIILPTHKVFFGNLQLLDQHGILGYTYAHELMLSVYEVWYKRWWAKGVLFALFLGLLGYLIYNHQKNKKLKLKISEFQTQSLRSQMNPHFISNSLNSINLYVLENKTDEASQYIVKFSKLIRQILNNTREEFVPLDTEIKALEMYIQMEKLRFKDKFEYDLQVADDVNLHHMVPAMILQPIVENAIWHGILQSDRNGFLRIDISNQPEGGLKVMIEDDGIGREASQRLNSKKANKNKSFGSSIVKQRLDLLHKIHLKNYSIQYEDLRPDALYHVGTKVTLLLS